MANKFIEINVVEFKKNNSEPTTPLLLAVNDITRVQPMTESQADAINYSNQLEDSRFVGTRCSIIYCKSRLDINPAACLVVDEPYEILSQRIQSTVKKNDY